MGIAKVLRLSRTLDQNGNLKISVRGSSRPSLATPKRRTKKKMRTTMKKEEKELLIRRTTKMSNIGVPDQKFKGWSIPLCLIRFRHLPLIRRRHRRLLQQQRQQQPPPPLRHVMAFCLISRDVHPLGLPLPQCPHPSLRTHGKLDVVRPLAQFGLKRTEEPKRLLLLHLCLRPKID